MFVSMQSVATIEQRFVDQLAVLYDANEARQLFFLLLEDRLRWSKRDYLLRKPMPLDAHDIEWLMDALSALKAAKPIQYVLGYAWFMDMKLTVDEAVLVPRPETEELVHFIISQHRNTGRQPLRIIDIGTGSGCIAIALKKAFPASVVHALDISSEALRVAKQNAGNQLADIRFVQADILEWELVFQPEQTFDIVVSNPPYITKGEQTGMHRNVLTYEPHSALFVEDSSPLLFYEHIAAFALEHLRPTGYLYFEINRKYGMEVSELLQKKGFEAVQCHTDIQGADRFVHAKRKRLGLL